MKKKLIGIIIMAFVFGMFMSISPVFATDKGPEKITINAQETYPGIATKKDKKKVADFGHHKHQDEYLKGKQAYSLFKYTDDWTCGACHHTAKKGETPDACLSCKDVKKMLDRVGGKFEKIYHALCRDACHERYDKSTDNDISKCTYCHIKCNKTTGNDKCKYCHAKPR